MMTKEELEKEAREYAEGMAMYYESAHGSIPSQFEKYLRNAYISSSKPREKRIEELEKENAELKAELSENKVADCHIVNGLCEQLTKAKICLEQLVSEITVGELEVDPNILQQAEQFLSEVEE